MITMTGIISSTIATAVRRWRQKSEVPECEAPRLRTRASGVRIDLSGWGVLIGRLRPHRQ